MEDQFDLSSLLGEFRQEARQQLDALDRSLIHVEESGPLPDGERVELQRVLHTLKGNAAMMGYRPIADLVHAVESVFKESESDAAVQQVDRLFQASAVLRSAVDHLGEPGEADALKRAAELDLRKSRKVAPPPERRPPPPPADAREAGESAASAEPHPPSEPSATAPPDAERRAPRPEGEASAAGSAASGNVVRVAFSKLDELLTGVGELLSLHARLDAFIDAHRPELTELRLRRSLEEHTQHIEDLAARLRDTTMALRLVPLQTIFGRFPAVVREVARGQGKRARMEVVGEGIEVDKTAADALAEPLLHLVRNAVDHGIEGPEEREAAGKDPTGTVRIVADRIGDQIQIEVSDDGRGIDRATIRQRASEMGVPIPDNVTELVFTPGFSTRRVATTVSGRGIGLDIVKRSVALLRGSLTLEPRSPGTAFILRMPLTLAIVPALIFETHGELLALPTSDVRETLSRRKPDRAAGAEVVLHEDRWIPLADPARLFGWDAPERATGKPRFPIVVRRGDRSAAVPADRLIDQRNVVVTAIPTYLGSIPGISGATVAPDGRVILLLDSDGMLDLNVTRQRRETGAARA